MFGISDDIWENKSFKKIVKNFIYFVFIVYFIFIFSRIAKNEEANTDRNNALYLTAIILPLIAFAFFIFSKLESKKYLVVVLIMGISMLLVILSSRLPSFHKVLKDVFYSFAEFTRLPPLSDDSSFLLVIISKLLLFCIFVMFITILFNVFLNESFRQKGKVGIFLFSLMVIPCLINDYVQYLFREFISTPMVVYVLILIEVILILLYIFIPKLMSKYIFNKSNRIIKEPMFLYSKKTVAGPEIFYNSTKEYEELEKQYKVSKTLSKDENKNSLNKSFIRNYSVSLWMTLNPPSVSDSEEIMLFRIGEDSGSLEEPDDPQLGTPYIGIIGRKLIFVFSNNEGNLAEGYSLDDVTLILDVEFQKWNNFVFNYNNNQVDLFVNGELMHSLDLANHLPAYNHNIVITVGSDTKKVHGAICELRVHSKVLNQTQIRQAYNILSIQNPPVNNLH